ncbi:MAG: hypothetical protein WCO63_16055 [Bacteroidota bacterium]
MSTLSQKITPWLVSLILALALALTVVYYHYVKVPTDCGNVVTDTIPGDRVSYSVDLPKPSPSIVFLDTGKPYWRYYKVDTAAILADHYLSKVYKDTIKNDSSALVVVIDTVRQNALQSRGLIFQNRRAMFVTAPLSPDKEPKYSFLIGAAIGRSFNEFGFMPTVAILNRKGQMYQVSYDLIQKDIYIGALWKIQRKIKIP